MYLKSREYGQTRISLTFSFLTKEKGEIKELRWEEAMQEDQVMIEEIKKMKICIQSVEL